MEYILDGYNVIKSSFLKKSESRAEDFARKVLIDAVTKYKKKHPSVQFTIVFDGNIPFEKDYWTSPIKIIFSGDITADEKIRILLEKNRDNGKTIVVSNDREVQTAAKILGGSYFKVEDFLDIVFPREKTPAARQTKATCISFTGKLEIEKELKSFYKEKK